VRRTTGAAPRKHPAQARQMLHHLLEGPIEIRRENELPP
jgi:hypothetical protein